MTARQRSAQLWGVPNPNGVNWRLAVVSRDASLARRAADALEREGLIVSIEAAGGEVSAVEAVERPPGILIVHGDRHERELERILRWAGRRLPHAVVVVVLPAATRFDIGVLLSMGASVLPEQDLDDLLGPVARAAAAGQVSVPKSMRYAMQGPALSHRERQILALAVAGGTNAQIARRLFIAESTVKTHLSSAFRRLGVHSRREAAAMILASDEVLRGSVLATLGLSEELPARDDEP